MKAVVTNKNNDYNYTIDNVTNVNFVENQLIIVGVDDSGKVATWTYFAKEVIVAIA